MRTIASFIILLLAFHGQTYAQDDTGTVYKNLETRKFYAVNLQSMTGPGKDVYEVNGRKVSKRTYKKFKSTWENMTSCCPCILQRYDENDHLESEAVSCTDCGVGWSKSYYLNGKLKLSGTYKENPTGDWKNIYKRGYCSQRHGLWTYFSKKGDTLYSELWANGAFVKQIPEQSTLEIWDVELMLNGENADSIFVSVAEVKDLTIRPKYKNSNTSSKLTLMFEVSAVGHVPNKKEFTLEEFKTIDVNAMLSEVGIKKNEKIAYALSVYSDGELVKVFYLDLK